MSCTAAIPLFTYGTLMQGEAAYARLAAAVVRSASAVLYGTDLYCAGWYPIALPGAGQVLGEVHWLATAHSAALLAELDAYEGDEYRRVVRPVRLLGGGEIESWVYLGDPALSVGLPLIPYGDWRRHLADPR